MGAIDRRRFLGASGATVAGLLAGCAGSDPQDGGEDETTTTTAADTTEQTDGDGGDESAINVGLLLPFTGEYDWVGANVSPVAQMLVDRINEGGGIDGRNINLVQGDTEATVDASVTAAQNLINVQNVQAIIGPTSLTFTGVHDLITENGVPVVSPTAGTTELNSIGGEYIFRTVPSDSLGGRAIAKAAREEEYNGVTSYEQMALMVGQAPALQSFKDPIRSSFEEFGGTITQTLDYTTGKSSYQSEVSNVMGSDPEVICLVGTPEDSVKIMRAAFQAGYEGNWFVTQDQTNADFLEQADPQITDGILGLQEADNPDAQETGRVEQFEADFAEYTGGDQPGLFAKNTYDAMTVTALAMTAAATAGSEVSRETIAANIREVANPPETQVTNYEEGASELEGGADIDYEGLVGPVDFDENGDITSPFAIMRVDGEEWQQVSTLPASELA